LQQVLVGEVGDADGGLASQAATRGSVSSGWLCRPRWSAGSRT
jgi:hypothetical protein